MSSSVNRGDLVGASTVAAAAGVKDAAGADGTKQEYYELRIYTPNLEERTLLTLEEGNLREIAYVPTGRGLVFFQSGDPISFSYIDAGGGTPVHLGDIGLPPVGLWYAFDPKGCYVLYKADSDSQTGTYLQPLP